MAFEESAEGRQPSLASPDLELSRELFRASLKRRGATLRATQFQCRRLQVTPRIFALSIDVREALLPLAYELLGCCHALFDNRNVSFELRALLLELPERPCEIRLLDAELFGCLKEAKLLSTQWRLDYNHRRPHSSLRYRTPAEFAASLAGPPVGAAPLPTARRAKQKEETLS